MRHSLIQTQVSNTYPPRAPSWSSPSQKKVIQLTEEYYAPGSLGSFNLQLQVTVQNNQNYTWLGSDYELVIMVMDTGVFVNERGTSSTFLCLLTKQDVLDALQQQPYSSNEVRKMVGGRFLDFAPGWAGLRASYQWSEACWSTCRANAHRRARTCSRLWAMARDRCP